MEQVILDHSDEDINPIGLISLFEKYPNFIIDENFLISGESFYAHGDGDDKYYTEINWKKEGILIQWINGRLLSEGKYQNNRKEGIWKKWWGNGKLYSEGNYQNNQMEGIWKEWLRNGELASEEKYYVRVDILP